MPTISQRGTRGRARVFALGCALATLIAAPVHLAASPALAGPDDSKYVATEGHVDSPKVFWNGTTFELKSEHGQPRPLEDTVNYLGKGYNADEQKWLFTVPENEPALDFLGEPGSTWFQAPQMPGWGNQPIWSGFGADAGVPADQFRDALFTLDIVEAEGPGQVEWFAWPGSSPSATRVPERFFSTSGAEAQSQSLQPGTHTHNFTLFEKPGRYNITYRATARAKDGTIIASEDTSLAWQVGGARPGSLTAPAASTEAPSSASNYRFTIAPAPADKVDARDAANTAKLSLGTLELGAAVNGTAEVFIDGHHFTDLAVTNGHAEFVDFLGDDAAKFQLRFTPSSGSAAPSWTSSPIDYASGRPEVTTTGTSDAELMTPIDATTEADFPTVSYTPARPATMNAGLKPGVGTDTFSVNVAIDDPKVFGFLDVIHYEPGNDRPSSTYTYWIPGGANVDARVEFASYMAGGKIVARFRPHPLIGTEVTETVLSNAYKVGETTTTTATIKPRADGSSPAPTATPSPTPPSGDQCSDRVLLDHGHIDMASAVLDGSTLKMFVKDDTRIAASGSVDRDASDVAIVASDASKFTRDARQSGAAWDRVLAPIGQENYLMPMTQVNDLPWPGYSTERVDHSRLDGPLTLSLTNVRGPGEFAMFQADTFGGNPKEILGSRDGAPTTISIASSTHAHAAWSFTKAGVYELDLKYTGKLKDGTALDTGVKTIRFAVGSAGKTALCGGDAGGPRTVDRLAGNDRYQTAVAVSKEAHPTIPTGGVPVILATGTKFPDALAAGPAAASVKGSLLLSLPDRVTDETIAEIARLNPATVTLVGSESALSEQVAAQVKAAAPSAVVERIGGADRYETAAKIAARFMPKATTAYLASGVTYPDAVAAAAAGSAGAASGAVAPVLLTTPGKLVPQVNLSSMKSLTSLHVVGSQSAIADSVMASAKSALPKATVDRLGGQNRMETSALVAASAPGVKPGGTVSIATGWNFPDALSASTLAGATGAPVLLSAPKCSSSAVAGALETLAPKRLVYIGGKNSVPDGVEGVLCPA